MIIQPRNAGWIEVICGPMFSGKTEELIRRMKRSQFARQSLQIFKPQIDDRYATDAIVSHSMQQLPSFPVASVAQMRDELDPYVEVIGIDEVQFFDEDVIEFCNEMADMQRRVVVAGLDQDYLGNPFGPIPRLLAVAEYVTKLHAICVKCGDPAHRSFRLEGDPQQVLVGSDERYEARCRSCFALGFNAPAHPRQGESARRADAPDQVVDTESNSAARESAAVQPLRAASDADSSHFLAQPKEP
ncbi:thymidine kinase [Bradymonas sediminis]|uniref:Thymidine kinase n=1 Tax=Bradymonas sediminis TaxID=1548548 RepID=A0A2Z4FJX8_9DELT|nr:thymidine kinase [Bradymonas sediminis]AWV88988.1 thymidine kinase [Bradymonas sediminis]TDP72000.1 thymidine kinase [Bradymonas sediminis]